MGITKETPALAEYGQYCLDCMCDKSQGGKCYAGFMAGLDGAFWGAALSDEKDFQDAFPDDNVWGATMSDPKYRPILQNDGVTEKDEWVDETEILAGLASIGSEEMGKQKANYPAGIWIAGVKYRHLTNNDEKIGESDLKIFMMGGTEGKVAALAVLPDYEGGMVICGLSDKTKGQDGGNCLNNLIACCKTMLGES